MAYFRNFFGGNAAEDEDDSGNDVVERLIERVETCTGLEDRRDALRALRNMAKVSFVFSTYTSLIFGVLI